MFLEERESTHVYRQKRMFTKEELEAHESLCVHEQPAYCNAACPLKLDTKAMVAAVASGDFTKALGLYEKITPFVYFDRITGKHCYLIMAFFCTEKCGCNSTKNSAFL